MLTDAINFSLSNRLKKASVRRNEGVVRHQESNFARLAEVSLITFEMIKNPINTSCQPSRGSLPEMES